MEPRFPNHDACDVDSAVRKILQRYMAGDVSRRLLNIFFDCSSSIVGESYKVILVRPSTTAEVYAEDCTYVPQAEYFDSPYGITVPVDNRKFPTSANDVLAEHGYTNMHIATGDIMHVSGCPEAWFYSDTLLQFCSGTTELELDY